MNCVPRSRPPADQFRTVAGGDP